MRIVSRTMSYAFITPRPPVRASYPPLLPVYPPPDSLLANPKPPASRTFLDPRYAVSTHLVPAAYLRSTPPASPPPPAVGPNATKEERRAANEARVEWVRAQARGSRGRYERILWSSVNRYVRRDVGEGAGCTLLLAHANGFPKETWEPALLDLLATGAVVDEIWAWEATHHGASFVLNAEAGTPLAACDWSDDARDVLNFLLHFLPSSIAGPEELPVHLHRVAPTESALRKVRGFSERTLFAAGHSFGGCCSAWAAITYPRLFSAIMLIDPVMMRYDDDAPAVERPSLAGAAISRRDSWPSREAAHTSFAANPFFASWDPRVLAEYVAHGLVSDPNGGVRLAMPPLQEALAFEGTSTSGPVWDMLPTLDSRISLRWVVPGRDNEGAIGPPGATRERVWLRPTNSSNVRIKDAGHLIVQQAPREIAREIATMLNGVPPAKL